MKAIEKELKSCPFCGGNAKIEHIDDTYLCYAVCTKCHATAQGFFNYPGSNSEEKSVFAWNRRAGEPPAADVQEVKHGYWIPERDPDEGNRIQCYHCSVCDDDFHYIGAFIATKYCPNCGARMDGEHR